MSSGAEARSVSVRSGVLGPLEIPDRHVYTFPDELYGFPGARTFALLPADREGFFWLQSLDSEGLAFLLIDPFLFVEGYSVDVGPDELGPLHSNDPADVTVLSILTLPGERSEGPTVNLQGPIFFNRKERLGKQVVVESGFGIRHPVPMRSRAG